MAMSRFYVNLFIALEALRANRLRALLTTLGVVFGVASLVAMLAIGRGTQSEIMSQMALIGSNNIVIKAQKKNEQGLEKEKEFSQKNTQAPRSPGLRLADWHSLAQILPNIVAGSPEVAMNVQVSRADKSMATELVGVESAYFELLNLRLAQGRLFNEVQSQGEAVCIIGKKIEARFFPEASALGKYLKCGDVWLRVVGVLEDRYISENSSEKLGIRNDNFMVYTPIKTFLLRYRSSPLQKNNAQSSNDEMPHQIHKIIVKVAASEQVAKSAEVIHNVLQRRHAQAKDFELLIPEQILQQQKRAKSVFNWVLGAIASISLLVGGIGILNIMLASVWERTREIGIRRAVGARAADIEQQFLIEAAAICLFGGLIGSVLGLVLAFGIAKAADIPVIVHIDSLLLALCTSLLIGVVFGTNPARKASKANPVEALHHE
jgi:putative ABC transport system permease protein